MRGIGRGDPTTRYRDARRRRDLVREGRSAGVGHSCDGRACGDTPIAGPTVTWPKPRSAIERLARLPARWDGLTSCGRDDKPDLRGLTAMPRLTRISGTCTAKRRKRLASKGASLSGRGDAITTAGPETAAGRLRNRRQTRVSTTSCRKWHGDMRESLTRGDTILMWTTVVVVR